MKLRLPFRSRLLLGVLCAALIGLLAIPVFASIPGPGGLINGCFQKSTGKLRVIDPSSSRPSLRACHPDEVAIHWNQVGPAGPPGPPGLSGYEMVEATFVVPAGGFVRDTVSCPSGKKVLGGGAQVVGEGSANFHTVIQELTVGTVGGTTNVFLAAVQNNDTKTHTIGIFATCAFTS